MASPALSAAGDGDFRTAGPITNRAARHGMRRSCAPHAAALLATVSASLPFDSTSNSNERMLDNNANKFRRLSHRPSTAREAAEALLNTAIRPSRQVPIRERKAFPSRHNYVRVLNDRGPFQRFCLNFSAILNVKLEMASYRRIKIRPSERPHTNRGGS
jgi:hypothetical protein